jgi:hypothetical protein
MHKKCVHLQYDIEDGKVLLFQRQKQIINSWVSVGRISLWKLHGKVREDCWGEVATKPVEFTLFHLLKWKEQGRHSNIGAGIFKQSMGVGKGLFDRPARLHSLAELVPWNRFLGPLKV